MSIAIVGWTGFVGQTLISKIQNADLYNSSNIHTMTNRSYDIVYFCGMPAEKWRINQNAETDYQNTQQIMSILKTIQANRFVLISTVDVLDCTISQDEKGVVYATHPYGKHRYLMETFISEQFKVHTILRLPGLFGRGLKKNIIYDLIHDNQIGNICLDSEFQWYNIENIVNDIQICISENRSCIQLVSPPISVKTILAHFFPDKLSSATGTNCITYNLITNTRATGYWSDTKTILEDMGAYIQYEHRLQKLPITLTISNIAWNHNNIKDILKVLSHSRIKSLEIAPTKITEWSNWSDETIRTLKLHNISYDSCQSILFNANIQNIFSERTRFIEHYDFVASICNKLGISTIVFGSPNARHVLDTSENDIIELFKTIGDIGEKYKVVCCIEPNSKEYGCTWLTNLLETVNFVKKINHTHIRITYDLGNYLMEKDTFMWDPTTIDLIGHVQISNAFIKPLYTLSPTLINIYSKQIQHIIALGYCKRISMEMAESSIIDFIKSIHIFMQLF